MDYDEQDSEVVRLLSRLRESESTYPADLMAARRQSFVKQVAALGIGTGAALALKEAAKAAGGSSIPPLAGTIVESVLIVAIVAEATFVAFVNREKVLDLFQTITAQPRVSHVTPAGESSRPLLAPTETTFIVTADPTVLPTLVTPTPTAVGTPSPEMAIVTEAAAGADTSITQVDSTPVPGGNNDDGNNNGNNGNHYGQTPAAERTKESGGGGGGGGDGEGETNTNNGNGNRNGK